MRKFCIVGVAWLVFLTAPYAHAQTVDSDGDGLTDAKEIQIYHTDPSTADTDGDGFSDGEEVARGYSPLVKGKKLVEVDTDKDYLPDAWEIALGTDLANPDSDGDGYLDGTEVRAGYDPLHPDSSARLEKLISVNLKQQRLAYSFGGKVLEQFSISSGLPPTPTPMGEFSVLTKRPLVHYQGPGFDFPNTRWNLRFAYGGNLSYYIHGAYWHNRFGRPASHGCVNVSYQNMERLYDWAQVGTKVSIAS